MLIQFTVAFLTPSSMVQALCQTLFLSPYPQITKPSTCFSRILLDSSSTSHLPFYNLIFLTLSNNYSTMSFQRDCGFLAMSNEHIASNGSSMDLQRDCGAIACCSIIVLSCLVLWDVPRVEVYLSIAYVLIFRTM